MLLLVLAALFVVAPMVRAERNLDFLTLIVGACQLVALLQSLTVLGKLDVEWLAVVGSSCCFLPSSLCRRRDARKNGRDRDGKLTCGSETEGNDYAGIDGFTFRSFLRLLAWTFLSWFSCSGCPGCRPLRRKPCVVCACGISFIRIRGGSCHSSLIS